MTTSEDDFGPFLTVEPEPTLAAQFGAALIVIGLLTEQLDNWVSGLNNDETPDERYRRETEDSTALTLGRMWTDTDWYT